MKQFKPGEDPDISIDELMKIKADEFKQKKEASAEARSKRFIQGKSLLYNNLLKRTKAIIASSTDSRPLLNKVWFGLDELAEMANPTEKIGFIFKRDILQWSEEDALDVVRNVKDEVCDMLASHGFNVEKTHSPKFSGISVGWSDLLKNAK